MLSLHLFHGRKNPEEQPDDWGFDGPTLDGVTQLNFSYLTHIIVVFKDEAAADAAQVQTGWERWDDTMLKMVIHNDLVYAVDGYYGDWDLYPTPAA